MANRFRTVDRETPYLFPPSVQEWLPETHLARFVVEVVSKLELRKLEQATYDSVAFRYLAGNTHPDHDTIAHFRKRFLEELKPLFVEILLLAQAMGFLKLGRVSLDGTKVKANASKHSALSWGHIQKLEARLREEVDELMQLAEEADGREETEGMDIPAELARREARLKAIDQAKQKLVERAAERQAAEHAEYEGKVAKRQAQRKRGNKPKGREPKPPRGGIRDQDQINLTDEDSRIMPVSGGGFEQCYNAQALVDNDSLLIVAVHVTPNANDKKELKPALAALHALPESLGRPQELLADNGYFSGANVELCSEHAVLPYIAVEREAHHLPPNERWKEPEPPGEDADAVEQMRYRLKTPAGRAIYGQRKAVPEPVFGIIKSVMGFAQFSLRGAEAADGEWTLASIAWNLKRMYNLACRQPKLARATL